MESQAVGGYFATPPHLVARIAALVAAERVLLAPAPHQYSQRERKQNKQQNRESRIENRERSVR